MISADVLYQLSRMRQAAHEARSFVANVELEDFLGSLILQRAVGMSLLMAGEMAVRILQESPDFAAAHPEVPWSAMRGMRNRMAHGYFDVNLERVWDTARTEARDLALVLDAILAAHP
jgi:uncharacterized protein with HEPN domain